MLRDKLFERVGKDGLWPFELVPAGASERSRGGGRRAAIGAVRVRRSDAVTRGLKIRVSVSEAKRGRAARAQPLEFPGSPTWTRTRDLRINSTRNYFKYVLKDTD